MDNRISTKKYLIKDELRANVGKKSLEQRVIELEKQIKTLLDKPTK